MPSLNEFFSCKNRANINWYSIAICFVIRSDKLQPELFFRLYGSNAKTISFLRITMCLLLYLLIFVSVLFYERSISFCPMCFLNEQQTIATVVSFHHLSLSHSFIHMRFFFNLFKIYSLDVEKCHYISIHRFYCLKKIKKMFVCNFTGKSYA